MLHLAKQHINRSGKCLCRYAFVCFAIWNSIANCSFSRNLTIFFLFCHPKFWKLWMILFFTFCSRVVNTWAPCSIYTCCATRTFSDKTWVTDKKKSCSMPNGCYVLLKLKLAVVDSFVNYSIF